VRLSSLTPPSPAIGCQLCGPPDAGLCGGGCRVFQTRSPASYQLGRAPWTFTQYVILSPGPAAPAGYRSITAGMNLLGDVICNQDQKA